MGISIRKTKELAEKGPHKSLLYAHHGFGKTYQCRFYEARYGKGLILSGEGGLKSLEDVDIDYIEFNSWNGPPDEETGAQPFKGIIRWIASQDFRDRGYNWIAIDSLTELSEKLLEYCEDQHKDNPNGFAIWGDYNRAMLGALKWIRDLPIHVYITCLAKDEKDANDMTHFWPNVKGNAIAKQVPALFDHVFCGVRTTEKTDKGAPRVSRYIVSDEVSGWHGKVRDPRGRLSAFEKCSDVTELLERMAMSEEEYASVSSRASCEPKSSHEQEKETSK